MENKTSSFDQFHSLERDVNNMSNDGKKKLKISSIVLLLLVIAAIAIIVVICVQYSQRSKNEEAVQEVVAEIKETPASDETRYIQYEGYQVIGTIQIPKFNIEYPILVESTEDSLTKSISRVGDGKVNEVGNLTLAGHNYIDGTMFGRIDELENGDEIVILDLYGNSVKYSVFNKYVTDPDDVSVLDATEEGTREVTLVTCTNGNSNRLIITAKEA